MIGGNEGFVNGAENPVGAAFSVLGDFLQGNDRFALLAQVAVQYDQKDGKDDKEGRRNADTFNELLLPVALNRQGENIPRRHWNAVAVEDTSGFTLRQ